MRYLHSQFLLLLLLRSLLLLLRLLLLPTQSSVKLAPRLSEVKREKKMEYYTTREILSHSRSFSANVLLTLFPSTPRHLVYFARQLTDTWTFV